MHKYQLTSRRSELQAVALSVLSSLLFLSTFVSFYKPAESKQQSVMTSGPSPPPVPSLTVKPPDPKEKYRSVPEGFKHSDFKNRSYGPYRFWGKKLNLTLTQGEREYPWEEGGGGERFSLTDVLYTDVTGDQGRTPSCSSPMLNAVAHAMVAPRYFTSTKILMPA